MKKQQNWVETDSRDPAASTQRVNKWNLSDTGLHTNSSFFPFFPGLTEIDAVSRGRLAGQEQITSEVVPDWILNTKHAGAICKCPETQERPCGRTGTQELDTTQGF